jgi:nitrogen fixation protein FixH
MRTGLSSQSTLPRLLTGRDVIVLLGLFFGVMFGANVALIYSALHTLHGGELENPYDASQAYNKRIAEAAAQAARGWTVNVMTRAEGDGMRVVAQFRDRAGAPIPGLEVRAKFEHPMDSALDRAAVLRSDGQGYEGVALALHPGRWNLEIAASRGGERLFLSDNKIMVGDGASD